MSNKFADTFLQINDQLNSVLNRYEAYKKGDYATASNPIPAELAPGAGGGDLSLIDLDETSPPATATPANDLSGLFASAAPMAPSPPQQQPPPQYHQTIPMMGANINMGMGMGGMTGSPMPATHSPAPLPFNANGGGVAWGLQPSMTPPHPGSTATPPASIMLPSTPAFGGAATPNYFNTLQQQHTPSQPMTPNMGGMGMQAQRPMGIGMGMGMGGGMGMGMGGGMGLGVATQSPHPAQSTPHPQLQPQQPQAQATPTQPQTQGGKDPFADLAGLF